MRHITRSKSTNIPTQEQLWNEELDSVHQEMAGWRHGYAYTTVFYRESDDTYWSVEYRASTDGDTNGLRDGDYTIEQVVPMPVTKTEYWLYDKWEAESVKG